MMVLWLNADSVLLWFLQKSIFRKLILKNCQDEFENRDNPEKIAEFQKLLLSAATEEDRTILEFKQKRRQRGLIKFIGELYLQDMIKDQIIETECLAHLLNSVVTAVQKQTDAVVASGASVTSSTDSTSSSDDVEYNDAEANIEALCNLLTTVASRFFGWKAVKSDRALAEKRKQYLDSIIDRLLGLDREDIPLSVLSRRIRFRVNDIDDLRRRGWKPEGVMAAKKPEPTSQPTTPKSDDGWKPVGTTKVSPFLHLPARTLSLT